MSSSPSEPPRVYLIIKTNTKSTAGPCPSVALGRSQVRSGKPRAAASSLLAATARCLFPSLLSAAAGRSCLCPPAQPGVGPARGGEHGERPSLAQPLQGAGLRPALEEAVFGRKWDVSSRRWLRGWLPASAAAGGSGAVAERHGAQPGRSGQGRGLAGSPVPLAAAATCSRAEPSREAPLATGGRCGGAGAAVAGGRAAPPREPQPRRFLSYSYEGLRDGSSSCSRPLPRLGPPPQLPPWEGAELPAAGANSRALGLVLSSWGWGSMGPARRTAPCPPPAQPYVCSSLLVRD